MYIVVQVHLAPNPDATVLVTLPPPRAGRSLSASEQGLQALQLYSIKCRGSSLQPSPAGSSRNLAWSPASSTGHSTERLEAVTAEVAAELRERLAAQAAEAGLEIDMEKVESGARAVVLKENGARTVVLEESGARDSVLEESHWKRSEHEESDGSHDFGETLEKLEGCHDPYFGLYGMEDERFGVEILGDSITQVVTCWKDHHKEMQEPINI